MMVIPIIILALVAGCSDQDFEESIPETALLNAVRILPPEENVDINADAKLAESAASVSASFTELARVERANQKRTQALKPTPAITVQMSGLATVDYTGPVDTLLKQIAKVSKVRFRKLGHPKGTPILVTVNSRNTKIVDIIRDISYQAQKQATVKLYPHQKVLELRYHRG
ncbi:MAG TPA: DotD/TraH family lipoprotein [Gammaproteobacteria bacterium]|nr:DotD/TraH family lipoprotein [Gammaproteobacteria bacterium]